MITKFSMQNLADAAAKRKSDSTRHKCFVSYHVEDAAEVEKFIDDFGDEFIARVIGVSDGDDFIDSDDDEYVKRRIREKYLTDSTVTIVLLGSCTWARKYIDWEISASLRNSPANRRSGLLVYPLPSRNNSAHLPDRVKDNWSDKGGEESYARYRSYPTTKQSVRDHVEWAFNSRTSKADKVNNSRALKTRNLACA